MPQLLVIAGPSVGTAFTIPGGVSRIGREPEAEVYLADAFVNHRHAEVRREGGRVTLTDLGSTNGTSVNGQPLRGSRDLRHGDVVRIGRVELAYSSNPYPDAAGGRHSGAGQVRLGRVRMGRVVLVAVVVEVLGLLAAAIFTFVAGRAIGGAAWLLVPAAAVVAGVVKAVIEAVANPTRVDPDDHRLRPGPRRGVSATVAVLAVVLLVGAGGYGAAVGIRAGVGWLTGNEDPVGRDRLASSPAPSDRSGRVTVTVTSVVNTAHFTRVGLTVVNKETQPATLTLFHNCVLTAAGVTLQADSFRSGWTQEVPPDSTQQGHVTFPGHLPDGTVTAQLSFLRVFVFGRFGVDDSVVIKPIRLRGA